MSCYNGHDKVVEALLDAGVKVNVSDKVLVYNIIIAGFNIYYIHITHQTCVINTVFWWMWINHVKSHIHSVSLINMTVLVLQLKWLLFLGIIMIPLVCWLKELSFFRLLCLIIQWEEVSIYILNRLFYVS